MKLLTAFGESISRRNFRICNIKVAEEARTETEESISFDGTEISNTPTGSTGSCSIGIRAVKARVDPKTRIRKLDAIDLWEISLVTFPLLAGARVRAVKDGQPSRPLPPARARSAIWSDPSARAFRPERLFRRHPRIRFEHAPAARTYR